jgi:hypothetical protein
MRSINIEKEKLLTILKANKEEHVKTFDEAITGYKAIVIAALEESLALARSDKIYRTSIDIDKPRSHENDYNSIIRMLEMSADEIIQLDEREFHYYVEDQWGWQKDFLMSGAMYSNTARRKAEAYIR